MKIPLTQRQVTCIDEEDYVSLSNFTWRAMWNSLSGSFYAARSTARGADRKQKHVFMHREIMGLEPGDPLDNRRSNLKVVTHLEHMNEHRNDPRRDVSKYGIGVRRRSSGLFQARVQVNRKTYSLGSYNTPEEAQRARREFLEDL